LFLLIIIFAFFYLSIVFNVEEIAENLKKSGAFIKGVRPGKDTAQYLRKVSLRLTAVGAVFLALLAILPGLLQLAGVIQVALMSGTGMLIAVGAIMEMKRQINSMIVVRNYDRYL
jgi:preprotein translocase subunit SecY